MLLLIILLLSGIVYLYHVKYAPHLIKKVTSIWCGIALFLYGALRHPSVGTDVAGYVVSYKLLQRFSFEKILTSTSYSFSRDPYFYMFMKLLTFISKDPQFMLAVISAIVAICVSVFIYKYSENVVLSFIMFVGLRFYSFTLTGLRQAIAMGIALLAYGLIKKNKFITFVLIIWFASFFHASAWAFLFAYPISKIKNIEISTMILPIMLLGNFFTGNSLVRLMLSVPLFNQYESYGSGENTESGVTILLIYFAIVIFAFMFRKRFDKSNDSTHTYYNFSLLGTTITSLGFNYANIFRIGYYYILGIILLLPLAINCEPNKQLRNLISFVIILLLVAQYIIIGPGAGTGEYKFFWE